MALYSLHDAIYWFTVSQLVRSVDDNRATGNMIFAVSKIDFEAMKVDACSTREACPMIALLVNAGNAHFVGTPKVVTSAHPYLVGE